jgi:predicted AlkP superfamily phosphohydrolase/phosphomutase
MPVEKKVAIIGLDCGDPTLVFERWLNDLPNLRRLCRTGRWGQLESCIPPITVPAWSCMASGRDPGALGVYGFRARRDWSYNNSGLATNLDIREPRLWDYLTQAGRPSITIGVPQTFPIHQPPLGCQITCFLTPSTESRYAHPPELAEEITRVGGPLLFDVEGFRSPDKGPLLQQVYRMAEQRFRVSRHLLTTKPWDLFWMVELGVDRLQHGFWHFMDPQHRRYQPGNPFEHAIHDYYVAIDRHVGELLGVLDLDRTAVWVVSDHGAQRLDGAFCVNDWLIRERLLVMKTPPTDVQRFDPANVDWSRTRAWSEGGYHGALYINRAGREPQGLVRDDEYEGLRAELAAKLEALPDHRGQPLASRVFKPEDLYPVRNGYPPDLLVLYGNLRWRSLGTIGHPSLYAFSDEPGAEEANHAQAGMYILSHPSIRPGRRDATLYDVAPTTLGLLGMAVPRGLHGRTLTGFNRTGAA